MRIIDPKQGKIELDAGEKMPVFCACGYISQPDPEPDGEHAYCLTCGRLCTYGVVPSVASFTGNIGGNVSFKSER